jgi:lipid-A-disaccharide synthase-like uncharacterized protein
MHLDWWLILGFAAQGFFFMRFVVQWIASERASASVFPVSFWYFSLGGTALLLIYSIHRVDPVFIAGQSLSSLIYMRNLHLIRAGKRTANQTSPSSLPEE